MQGVNSSVRQNIRLQGVRPWASAMLAKLKIGIKPLSKERPRTGKSGHVYTPTRTREYEEAIRMAAIMALPSDWEVPTGPVKLTVVCCHMPPKSWPGSKIMQAARGEIYPQKGDLDNKVKAISDALNGVLYQDDVQIVQLQSGVMYGPDDMLFVRLDEAEVTDIISLLSYANGSEEYAEYYKSCT